MRYASAAGRWVITATVLGSAMAAIDATVVGIALPSIGRNLHTSFGTLQWVVSGYLLMLSALLLWGGALGDRYGRRKVFQIGVVWFTLASALCALAPNAGALVAARALQGAGAALLTPGSLAIIEAVFDPDDRAQAVGAWSGLGGVATAAGPLLGGYLISAASWRWIFVINVPLGALVFWVTARHVPESRDPNPAPHMDWKGAVTAVGGLAAVTYALIEGGSAGWSSPAVVGCLAGGTALLVAFVVVERLSAAPMLPPSVFRLRRFTVTNAATLFIYAALSGALFLLPVELQVVDHYSPFEAGLSLLPLTAIMLLLSAQSGRLASRIGPRLQMTFGPVLVALGLALLARANGDANYATAVLPAVIVMGLGLAATVAPLTATALAALPGDRAGLASAVNNDVARIGGLIAVSVLPALAGISGSVYTHPAQFGDDFRTAVFITAGWCLVAAVIAFAGLDGALLPERGRAAPTVSAGGTQPSGAVPTRAAGLYCALDAPPMNAAVGVRAAGPAPGSDPPGAGD